VISNGTKIYGLVLAGGKSVRMGHDKSIIKWHGKEQRYYIADLLEKFCDEVYISCREEQVGEIDSRYKTITDKVDGKGPIVGILSAFETNNNVAWLVVACDLPLIDEATITYLIQNRDTDKVATTYKSPHDGLPEPLITIWEPYGREVLWSYKAEGYNCPRKALINSDTLVLEPLNADALINTNTPEEAERVREILNKKMNIV
jgi:molybdopterin-guanine dinucleotide biosynthesis protein A